VKIKKLFENKKIVLSFEIFPPKKNYPIDTIYKTIEELSELSPDYISVTYGASGTSESHRTLEIASLIKNKYNIESLAHLTCINSSKDKIFNLLEELKNNNVENILALRGDLPIENKNFPMPHQYKYAVDLIKHIKSFGHFSIGAACYPEGHIESKNIDNEIIYLKEKIDVGTDYLISQLFFENEHFYSFINKLEKNNIKIPVQAGIMPVINKKQIEKIVFLSGAYLPEKFLKILNTYEDNPKALEDAGIAYACDQIVDLITSGVRGIHLYAMNRPKVIKRIISNISSILK
jgi:methylenetetrahydrofolate reductase (NADPH)